MKLVNIIDPLKLESILERYIKQAYKEEDYLRCRNLVNHLLKINSANSVGRYYDVKLTPSLLKKEKYKWLGFRGIGALFTDIKFYITILMLIIAGRR